MKESEDRRPSEERDAEKGEKTKPRDEKANSRQEMMMGSMQATGGGHKAAHR